jgi:hypothetical protein
MGVEKASPGSESEAFKECLTPVLTSPGTSALRSRRVGVAGREVGERRGPQIH